MAEEKWFEFKNFKCPTKSCKDRPAITKWVCHKDDTAIYISQRGNLSCSKRPGYHIGKICTWHFDCGNHGNHPVDRWRNADLEGFTFAMSQAVQLVGTAGATWVSQLVLELGTQFGSD